MLNDYMLSISLFGTVESAFLACSQALIFKVPSVEKLIFRSRKMRVLAVFVALALIMALK